MSVIVKFSDGQDAEYLTATALEIKGENIHIKSAEGDVAVLSMGEVVGMPEVIA